MKIEGNSDGISIQIGAGTNTDAIRVISVGSGNELSIGSNCRIAGHFFLAHGAKLLIGDNLKCTSRILCHLHEGASVRIGNGCLFASEVSFRPTDAHKIFDLETGSRINAPQPITIGNNVWIGENALILKGRALAMDRSSARGRLSPRPSTSRTA